MTTRNLNRPIPAGIAADRIAAAIRSIPDEAGVERLVRELVAKQVAEKRADVQQRIAAITARVIPADRDRLPGVVLALLQPSGLCGFDLGGANDAGATEEAQPDLVPERLREPLSDERLAVAGLVGGKRGGR